MKNLIQSYNHDIAEQSENLYLCFYIDENRYAINVQQIVEIMKRSKLYKIDSEQTYRRRASTVLSWTNWVLELIEE